MRSCQSAGSTVVTSPQASANHHPVNATTAAARLTEFTLEGDKKGGVNRATLGVVGLTFTGSEKEDQETADQQRELHWARQ